MAQQPQSKVGLQEDVTSFIENLVVARGKDGKESAVYKLFETLLGVFNDKITLSDLDKICNNFKKTMDTLQEIFNIEEYANYIVQIQLQGCLETAQTELLLKNTAPANATPTQPVLPAMQAMPNFLASSPNTSMLQQIPPLPNIPLTYNTSSSTSTSKTTSSSTSSASASYPGFGASGPLSKEE